MKSPRLHAHLIHLNVGSDTCFRDMFSSLFTDSLSLDQATRLWDIMVFEGDAMVVRAGVAYLTAIEGKLFGSGSCKEVYSIVKEGLNDVSEEDWVKLVKQAGKSS